MTTVTVNLYASFRQYIHGQASTTVDIERGESIALVLEKLGVPTDQARIIFCDNRLVDLEYRLEGGESLGIFPAIGGG